MTEKIEIKQADFDDDMSVEEILQKVAAEACTKAAIALCEAFGNRSEDFDLSGGGGKHLEIRDVSARHSPDTVNLPAKKLGR